MTEIWKPDVQTNGKYEVSNLGRIRHSKRKIPLKLVRSVSENSRKHGYGHDYYQYNNYENGKRKSYLVHRAVALAFLSNPENKRTVNHISGDYLDNRVENLEWTTDHEQHIHQNKVLKHIPHPPTTSVMCIETKIIYASTREAERMTGIHSGSISRSCKQSNILAGGYHWKYV